MDSVTGRATAKSKPETPLPAHHVSKGVVFPVIEYTTDIRDLLLAGAPAHEWP